jgi:hypothetical protein
VRIVGRIDTIVEQLFAITTERQLSHPAIVAISQAARSEVFGNDALTNSGKAEKMATATHDVRCAGSKIG